MKQVRLPVFLLVFPEEQTPLWHARCGIKPWFVQVLTIIFRPSGDVLQVPLPESGDVCNSVRIFLFLTMFFLRTLRILKSWEKLGR